MSKQAKQADKPKISVVIALREMFGDTQEQLSPFEAGRIAAERVLKKVEQARLSI